MTALEAIIARGNRGHGHVGEDSFIACADGFRLSVIAGGGTYCLPRPVLCAYPLLPCTRSAPDTLTSTVACDFQGPYWAVEVGYPSARPEPWAEWQHHFEDWGDTDPTGAVYGYVPVALVRDLIASHGGEVSR